MKFVLSMLIAVVVSATSFLSAANSCCAAQEENPSCEVKTVAPVAPKVEAPAVKAVAPVEGQ